MLRFLAREVKPAQRVLLLLVAMFEAMLRSSKLSENAVELDSVSCGKMVSTTIEGSSAASSHKNVRGYDPQPHH